MLIISLFVKIICERAYTTAFNGTCLLFDYLLALSSVELPCYLNLDLEFCTLAIFSLPGLTLIFHLYELGPEN